MESSPSSLAPLLLRNLLISLFVYAEKSLLYLSQKSRLLQFIRSFLVSVLLFFLNLLPVLFSSITPSPESRAYPLRSSTNDDNSSAVVSGGAAMSSFVRGVGNSGVSRALCQLLLLMNEIPVSSRKYEVVRSLIEKLVAENLAEGSQALREVNCAVLSAAFGRTLSQLESAVVEQRRSGDDDVVALPRESGGSLLLKGVSYIGRKAWRYAKSGGEMSRSGNSAEKLAAELLWLVQKMAASGCAEEAVHKWASASKLAVLGFSAEPRLQGSLVKVSAFLIEQAKDVGQEQEEDGNTGTHKDEQFIRQTKVKLLVSWLPLLCRATNGTDAPIMNFTERTQLEKTLDEIVSTLEADEQELVLSLWLHHFTFCPASDWPNMRTSYTQWYNASRTRLLASAAASASSSSS